MLHPELAQLVGFGTPWPEIPSMNLLPVVLLALGSAFTLRTSAGSNQQASCREMTVVENAACTACPRAINGEAVEYRYRGRVLRFHPGECEQHWTDNPDGVFAKISPRAALFAESSTLVERLRNGWFGFGSYVIVGLLSGAACAYIAVGRGRAAANWFFLGLIFNLFAVATILIQRKLLTRDPEGIPSGMNKVPVTRSPRRCSVCSSENHPAATRCLACGGELEAVVRPETTTLRTGENA